MPISRKKRAGIIESGEVLAVLIGLLFEEAGYKITLLKPLPFLPASSKKQVLPKKQIFDVFAVGLGSGQAGLNIVMSFRQRERDLFKTHQTAFKMKSIILMTTTPGLLDPLFLADGAFHAWRP